MEESREEEKVPDCLVSINHQNRSAETKVYTPNDMKEKELESSRDSSKNFSILLLLFFFKTSLHMSLLNEEVLLRSKR